MVEHQVAIEGLRKDIDHMRGEMRQMWVQVDRNAAEHIRYDVAIEKMATTMDHVMSRLADNIERIGASLKEHLVEEDQDRRETIKSLKSLMWTLIASAITGAGGIIWTISAVGKAAG